MKTIEEILDEKWEPITKHWDCYPIGTKAKAISGGHWIKTDHSGWKWCNGSVFPTPGGDAISVLLPKDNDRHTVTQQPLNAIKTASSGITLDEIQF